MDIYSAAEKLMLMNARSWARHANPISVYSRIFGGSLIFLAAWSPFWFGWSGAFLILLALVWNWVNPRLFPPPTDTKSWATQGVLGERAYINRKITPVPFGFEHAANLTTALSLTFLLLTIIAFIRQDFWFAFTAWHGATAAKLWFVDRMAWLWTKMRDATPEYKAWNRAEWDYESDVVSSVDGQDSTPPPSAAPTN